MAGCARLQIVRPRALPVHRAGRDPAMTLVAQCIDRGHVQQARILRAVGRVARTATLGLHRSMLVYKRPTNIGVALGADCVLVGRRFQVAVTECAVYVVAVVARNQAFIDLVVERHVERRLSVGVALEAERRLRSLQQLLFLALMNAMAADTADVGLGVGRAVKVRVRSRVTGQALGLNLFGRVLRGIEDLALVAAALHMRLASAVAVFTGNASAGVAMHQRHLGMRIFFKSLGDSVVTAGAGCIPDKLSSFRTRSG